MRKIKTIAASATAAVLLIASNVDAAPVSYTDGIYTENFDSLVWLSWGNTTAWVDGSTVPGWYASGVEWLRSTSGNAVNTSYKELRNFGTSDGDNALGSQVYTRVTDWITRYGVQIVNNTGQPLTNFTLSYFGELWSGAYQPRIEQLTFEYAVNALSFDNSGYIAAPELNFVTPHMNANGALDGNLAGNRRFISATISGLNWLPGQSLWLRWTDVDDPGTYWDAALAIDDLEFSAKYVTPLPAEVVPEPSVIQPAVVSEPNSVALSVISMLALGIMLRRREPRS